MCKGESDPEGGLLKNKFEGGGQLLEEWGCQIFILRGAYL